MKVKKKRRLQNRGWRIGTAADFLELTPEEAALVELKLVLSRYLRVVRQRRKLSQVEVANLIGSSQSRVAKVENGDPSVTLDLLIKALLALGTTRRAIARLIAKPKAA